MLNYQTGILLQYAEANNCEKLPPLISVVYYHGKRTPYPYSLNWLDCFERSDLDKEYTLKPLLIDLGQLSDEMIKKKAPEIAGPQLAFKHIFARDFSRHQTDILTLLQTSPLT